jgi:hypothetical protein
MPPFGGERLVTLPVPKQTRFAQTRARSDHGGIATGIRRTRLQSDQIIFAQCRQPVCSRFQVIEQGAACEAETELQCIGIDKPWQIGGFHHPALHRTGDTECRMARCCGARKKFVQHYFERGVITARITEFMHDLNLSAADFDDCETRLGCADVTCKNIFHGQVLGRLGDRRNLRTMLPPILPSPIIANRINPPGNNSSSTTVTQQSKNRIMIIIKQRANYMP